VEFFKFLTQYKYLDILRGLVKSRSKNRGGNRISAAGKCFHSIKTLLNKKEISKRTKVAVYRTLYRPILTYSCES
jgi:hypothetical protein